MTNKENYFLKTLKNIEGIDDLIIEKDESSSKETLTTGEFDYFDSHYSFFYRINDPLLICEISFMFTFEKVTVKNITNLYKAIDSLNSKSFCIKATILDWESKKKELTIDFSYGILSKTTNKVHIPFDIEPAISILSMIPEKMSIELKDNGIKHDYIGNPQE